MISDEPIFDEANMVARPPTQTRKTGEESEPLDAGLLEQSYFDQLPRSNALVDEVAYILEDAVSDAGIKVHAIESRVKTLYSIMQKANNKNLNNPLEDLNDIVGARIVCLFRSDLPKIDSIIRDSFLVLSVDDKTVSSDGSTGYLSIHYVCTMRGEYKGPRYKKIHKMRFEIQLRTICMHAWAAVSHYLDYKGEWDVPLELKKSLNALSGLFYVADSEFQKISEIRSAARTEITTDISSKSAGASEINFDTVYAVIESRYDRPVGASNSVSDLVHELRDAGVKTIGEWINLLDKGDPQMVAEDVNRGNDPYVGVGCARVSTGKADPNFDQILKRPKSDKK